ncbi:MAG: uroporphyrinogen-III C-methyltransferase [Desulfovibrionaceae bacterium]|nr:uroporphyrinogen-III C-methyltransferase [Desulfovibrionaceae bacterium]
MSKVYLIGAGPGDPGLLTLKAKALIERADVVVYDYLANKDFLRYARPGAEIIYVGKKGGDHTLPQDQINALLVAKAKEGKLVARLKGGDPYVFGRGAEEAEELLDAGVSFEVVPGVTSAVAAPAYAGIPVTHRAHASMVSFITGHEDPGKRESALNWKALAEIGGTLVFFMGVKNLPEISANLIANGRAPSTPAALVRWGTTCRHRSLIADLATIAGKAKEQGFAAPSLLVVGGVVGLHDRLSWFEKRPLLGKGMVVTRAREQASSLAGDLTELGACVYEFPTIEIADLGDYADVRQAIAELAGYDWLVFTSVNGVKYFWRELAALGLDTRALGGRKTAAIGPATAEALALRGIAADFVPEKYVAESVVAGLLALGIGGKNVLVPRAAKAREVLPEELARAGCKVTVLPVYETRLASADPAGILAALRQGEISYITFSSSSTVENFFALIASEALRSALGAAKLACIGPVTAATLATFGFTAHIQPEEFTIPALVAALVADQA